MKEETKTNVNAGVIANLREAADFLESKPGLPPVWLAYVHMDVKTADELRQAARALGSFKKEADDYKFRLRCDVGAVQIEVSISRETICKKRIIWDCPEDLDSLLKVEATREDR